MTLASPSQSWILYDLEKIKIKINKNKSLKCNNFGALNLLEDFMLVISKIQV